MFQIHEFVGMEGVYNASDFRLWTVICVTESVCVLPRIRISHFCTPPIYRQVSPYDFSVIKGLIILSVPFKLRFSQTHLSNSAIIQ